MSTLGLLLSRWSRQTQRLFHTLVGLLFLGLALAGAAVSVAEWRFHLQVPSIGVTRFAMLAGFTVFLVILGLYSFLKARGVR